MNCNSNNGYLSFSEGRGKDIDNRSERQRIAAFLYDKVATCTMLCEVLGIKQKNATRRKRELEKAGILFDLGKGICQITKRRASYLTTNPEFVKTKMWQYV